jgi:putative oxidoreductase
MLASHHLPMVKYCWILAVVVELGGGLALLVGLLTRPIGLVLAIWCVATALIAHTNFADRNQEIHFLKNMAMMGGFSTSRRSAAAPGVSTHGGRAGVARRR